MTSRDHLASVADLAGATAGRGDGDVLQAALVDAEGAARAAGVTVRAIHDLTELRDVVALYATIWGRSANPPMTLELLRAFTKAGNYVGGAFEGGRLVGACVGFFHAPAEDALHSHIAGVTPELNGRHVGFALKLHQRAWALLRGVAEIAWTFDPLVSRNAYFNLVKLAARPDEYLTNFYGPMHDTINGADDSDRLLVRWHLRDPAVLAACAGRPSSTRLAEEMASGAVIALGMGPDGAPDPGGLDGPTALVAVPRDIGALRATDPSLAQRWRVAVRETLSALLAEGGVISGFDRAGWYIVRRAR
jgi:predicted GNAT superfamily acetyltransferase